MNQIALQKKIDSLDRKIRELNQRINNLVKELFKTQQEKELIENDLYTAKEVVRSLQDQVINLAEQLRELSAKKSKKPKDQELIEQNE